MRTQRFMKPWARHSITSTVWRSMRKVASGFCGNAAPGAKPLVDTRGSAKAHSRAATVRVCEKIATITGLADEIVCPTLAHKGLRLGGAGVFACQPIFLQVAHA